MFDQLTNLEKNVDSELTNPREVVKRKLRLK